MKIFNNHKIVSEIIIVVGSVLTLFIVLVVLPAIERWLKRKKLRIGDLML